MDEFYAIFRSETHAVFFSGDEGFLRVLDLTLLGRDAAVEVLGQFTAAYDASVALGMDLNAGSPIKVHTVESIPACFKPALDTIPLNTIALL